MDQSPEDPSMSRLGLKIGAILLVAGLLFRAGWKVSDWRHASAELKEQKQVEIVYRDREVQVFKEGKQVVVRQDVIRWRTKEIIKEVNVYVPQAVNVFVPNGAVRLHDAAATNQDPPAPSASDGAASDVNTAAFVTGVIDNYGVCNVWREQLIGLQSYVKTVVPDAE
jgi:hypothetical protein